MFHLILSWSRLHSGSSVRYCGRCRWCRCHRRRPWRWRCRCHASRFFYWATPRRTHFRKFGSATPIRFRGHSLPLVGRCFSRPRCRCRCRGRIRARAETSSESKRRMLRWQRSRYVSAKAQGTSLRNDRRRGRVLNTLDYKIDGEREIREIATVSDRFSVTCAVGRKERGRGVNVRGFLL